MCTMSATIFRRVRSDRRRGYYGVSRVSLERMTSEQKKVWKELAKTRNIEENRHGRRKLAGYWVFAKQIVATFSDQTKSVEDLIGFVVANLSVSELDMWETLDDVAGLFPSTGTNYTVNTWVVEELTEIF